LCATKFSINLLTLYFFLHKYLKDSSSMNQNKFMKSLFVRIYFNGSSTRETKMEKFIYITNSVTIIIL